MHGPRQPEPDQFDVPSIEPSSSETVSTFRAAWRFAVSAVVLVLLGAVVYMWPASLGGRSTIAFVNGTSMLPTLTADDVVLARAQVDYAVGDLVVFRVPEGEAAGEYIIHRIIGGGPTTGWVTRGDNRTSVDPWFLADGDVVGRADSKAAIGPVLRTTFNWILAPIVWSIAAAIVAYVVVLRYLRERDVARAREAQSRRNSTDNTA